MEFNALFTMADLMSFAFERTPSESSCIDLSLLLCLSLFVGVLKSTIAVYSNTLCIMTNGEDSRRRKRFDMLRQ